MALQKTEFKTKYKVDQLPFGIWAAEAFDVVTLLAKTIARCGETPESVKQCLYQTHDYPGASGSISIDANGDGIRKYVLKEVKAGVLKPL